MLYASESWPLKGIDLAQLERNEQTMVRWICGIKPEDRLKIYVLRERLGTEDLESIIKLRRLCWFSHVQRSDGWIKKVGCLHVSVQTKRGRPWKTWAELKKANLETFAQAATDNTDSLVEVQT